MKKGGFGAYLEGDEDGVRLADEPDDDGTLLERFLGVLDLEDAALGGAAPIASVIDAGSRSCCFPELHHRAHKVTESLS